MSAGSAILIVIMIGMLFILLLWSRTNRELRSQNVDEFIIRQSHSGLLDETPTLRNGTFFEWHRQRSRQCDSCEMGHLFLTNQRLVFQPYWGGRRETVLNLSDIASVEKVGYGELVVYTIRDDEHAWSVNIFFTDGWIRDTREILKSLTDKALHTNSSACDEILLSPKPFVDCPTGIKAAGLSNTIANHDKQELTLPPPLPRTEKTVQVNSAEALEIAALPGIGPLLATRIIRYRETKGDFESFEEFSDFLALKPHTSERLRPLVSITERESKFRQTTALSKGRKVDY